MRTLLFALLVTASAQAFEIKRDSTGEPASWKSALSFVVDEAFAAQLKVAGAQDAVDAAVKTVNAAVPSLTMGTKAGKPHGMGYDFNNPKASTSDVVAPEEWSYNTDAVATTVITISRSTHQIIEADIAFNVRHTAFGVGASHSYDIQNAMTHELGHALGLAHNDLPGTVMYPSSQPGEISKRTLASDDLDGLRFLYGAPAAVTPEQVARGCSATGTAPFALAALLMGGLLRRRRVLVALLVLLVVAPVFAGGQRVAQGWRVSAVTTLPPSAGSAVLQSDVTLVLDGEQRKVRMPGGRWGDLEQVVEGVAVPMVGEELGGAVP